MPVPVRVCYGLIVMTMSAYQARSRARDCVLPYEKILRELCLRKWSRFVRAKGRKRKRRRGYR